MPTVAVVGSRKNVTNERLVARWRALGIPARLVSAAEARACLDVGDAAVGRLDVLATLDGVEPGLLDLLLLEGRGIAVRNPARALVAVHDKLLTARKLGAAGVPHPRTGCVRTPADPLPVRPPLVVKPRFGSWGKDVYRCADEREARRQLRRLVDRPWFRRHGALVQEFVDSRSRDVRLIVAGGRVVGAIERIAAPGNWRTNISLGGTVAPLAPDDESRALALAAAAAVGGDLVGVDLLPLASGRPVVVELNGAVDFDERYSLPGRDVFRESAHALRLDVAGIEAAATARAVAGCRTARPQTG